MQINSEVMLQATSGILVTENRTGNSTNIRNINMQESIRKC